ncbi:MAG: ABC transporter ATP-binding protein [Oscillospiraceae bacterium]
MNDFLSVENISLAYQTPTEETLAIKNVSIKVEEGQFVSIVGPSGCGKSTLLSCIAGLREPTSGKIYLQGERVSGISEDMGYMLQSDNLLPWRSIYKNVMLGLEIQKKLTDGNIQYVDDLLKKYGLWEFRHSYPSRLSGGMRQRVALIRTLAVKPRLLLLDEAFSALDYQTRVNVSCDVYNILRKENKTMVMVTHDIPEAVAMSDKVIILSQRPAVVKQELIMEFDRDKKDPINVRNDPRFQTYFNVVWGQLQS